MNNFHNPWNPLIYEILLFSIMDMVGMSQQQSIVSLDINYGPFLTRQVSVIYIKDPE